MDEADISKILRQVIREEIKSLLAEQKKTEVDNTIQDRKQICDLLRISLSTLYNYQKA